MKILLIALITSFGFFTDPIVETTKTVNVEQSVINWTGKKVTGSHNGTLKLKEGSLTFDGDALTGGSFVIDMNSLSNNDLGEGGAAKLVGHLKSDDFFSVATHPTAKLVVTAVNGDEVTGDLTIKNITHPISFNVNVGFASATADITVDRTKYDVKYGSGSFFDNLGDKAINDNFELNVNLVLN